MDRLTVKKIIEINCKKNRICNSNKSKELNKAYQNLIDSLPDYYSFSVSLRLSEVDTPILIIENKKNKLKPNALVYCFENNYYLHMNYKTTITSDLDEASFQIENYYV